ncbi:hypothetical protein [Rosistilla oblonga]|uniref:Uncharacterized protein n=1 Tax=Rosistilla oblonga TaxID=2527990 RepID=A0A518ITV6_9BACT|nr:hypothetical protein [Rosistilla oblonga]QDV56522.1 hypothetical protein Mal33_25130 [Rosistilla oblonga]
MATAAALKALFETGDILTEASFVSLIDSMHPDVVTLGTFTGETIPNASTVKEALQSLETALEAFEGGTDGEDGADGASAYELAVGNGFVGDLTAWLASLAGADGEDGTDGTSGIPAVKTANFTAVPGEGPYLVSLSEGDVIATIPVSVGAYSIIVTEPGETIGYYEASGPTPYSVLLHCDDLTDGETTNAAGGTVDVVGGRLTDGAWGNAIVLEPDAGLPVASVDLAPAIYWGSDWTFDGVFFVFGNPVGVAQVKLLEVGSLVLSLSPHDEGFRLRLSHASGVVYGDTLYGDGGWFELHSAKIGVTFDSSTNVVNVYLDGALDLTATIAAFTYTEGITPKISTRGELSTYPALLMEEVRWSQQKEWSSDYTPATSPYIYLEGSSGGGYLDPVPNKLTIAGTTIQLREPGSRVDIQCDGTNTVYQYVGHSLETVAADASVATLIAKLTDAGLILAPVEA